MVFLQWNKEFVVNRDLFSKDISLTYRGQPTFKTFFGGWVSLVIIVTMVIYALMLFTNMIKMKDLQVKWNILSIDSQDQQSEYDVLKDGLIYSIVWTDSNYSTITKEYGSIQVFLHNMSFSQSREKMQETELDVEIWENKKRQRQGKEHQNNINMWWIKDK